MPTYQQPPDDLPASLIAAVIERHHPDLYSAKVQVSVLYAYPTLDKDGEPLGPAIVQQGREVTSTIKVNSLSDRAEGKLDATLKLDGDWFLGQTTAEQTETIDRELMKLAVKRDEAGNVLPDDLGRPKLMPRLPDVYLCGWSEIARRYGPESITARQIANLLAQYEAGDFAVDDEADDPQQKFREEVGAEFRKEGLLAGTTVGLSVNGGPEVVVSGEQFEKLAAGR